MTTLAPITAPNTEPLTIPARQRLQDAIARRQHVTYQMQYRKCGKKTCGTCQDSRGHGPYCYAYFRDSTGKLRSAYVGKHLPNERQP